MARNIDKLFDNDGRALMCIFCGKSFRGKSHFLRYLITDRMLSKKLEFGLVFTGTKYNTDYDFFPDDKVFEGYNEEVLKKYVDNLKAIKKKEGEVPPSFIIFDDLVGVLNNQTDFFMNFITTARHLNINIFVCVQYLTGKKAISTTMRAQTTHAVLFKPRMKNTIENLYRSFGGLFENEKEFKDHFMKITKEPYCGMLYLEHEDNMDKNYICVKAPAEYPKIDFDF
jgi:hypothetical protein